jgi:hypothetical protein
MRLSPKSSSSVTRRRCKTEQSHKKPFTSVESVENVENIDAAVSLRLHFDPVFASTEITDTRTSGEPPGRA